MAVFSGNFLSPSLLVWARGVLTSLCVSLRVTPSPGTSATCVTSASHGGTTSLCTSGRSTSSNGPRDILASGTAHLYPPSTSSPVQDTAGAASCIVLAMKICSRPSSQSVNIQWDLSSAGCQLQGSDAITAAPGGTLLSLAGARSRCSPLERSILGQKPLLHPL